MTGDEVPIEFAAVVRVDYATTFSGLPGLCEFSICWPLYGPCQHVFCSVELQVFTRIDLIGSPDKGFRVAFEFERISLAIDSPNVVLIALIADAPRVVV